MTLLDLSNYLKFAEIGIKIRIKVERERGKIISDADTRKHRIWCVLEWLNFVLTSSQRHTKWPYVTGKSLLQRKWFTFYMKPF